MGNIYTLDGNDLILDGKPHYFTERDDCWIEVVCEIDSEAKIQ